GYDGHGTGEGRFAAVKIGAVLEDFNEGDKEVVDSLAELLHVGVLVGGAFVAENVDALIGLFAGAVEFLAERLHDELLEVFGKVEEAIFIGKHDHVFGVPHFAAGGVIPHQGQESGGVFINAVEAGDQVGVSGAFEHGVDIKTLERRGEQADGGKLTSAPPYPI